MANAPLVGWDAQGSRSDLGWAKIEIFLQRGLDCPNQIDPVQEFSSCAHAVSSTDNVIRLLQAWSVLQDGLGCGWSLCDNNHGDRFWTVLPVSPRSTGMIPSRDKQGNAMTDLNSENRELSINDLTIGELDSVSGGRIKLPVPDAVKAWEIAKIQRDNPGF
jgi:hypothetical protein